MASDPHWNKVVLALKCDGTNGSTTFTDEKGKTVTVVGNAQISTAQSKFGGASGYFDGTGDYLTIPAGSDFDFGTTGDFTVEAFVYIAANSSLDASNRRFAHILSIDNGTAEQFSFYVAGDASTTGTGLGLWNGTNSASATATISQSAWHHVAVTRYAGNLRFFLDGTQEGTTTAFAYQLGNSTYPPKVGGRAWSANYYYYLNGYIDDLRITKGVARYTANFTPPTASFPTRLPVVSGTVKDASGNNAQRLVRVLDRKTCSLLNAGLSNASTGAYSLPVATADEVIVMAHDTADADPYWSSVVLAMHMNGSNNSTYFKDEIGKTVTPSGDAKISTAQSKFGGASAYFDGAGDYLSTSASSDFSHGTGDFTIEFWCRPTTATNAVLLDGRAIGPDGPQVALWLNAASRLELYVSGAARIAGTSAVATASWHHIALSRASGTTRLFLDGVSLGTWADSTSYSETRYVLGADRAGSLSPFTGYIDDLRITKGVARYTANFTPPTAAFPNSLTGGTENAVILDRVIPI